MSIRDWPAAERPREKLLEQGAASLTDAELLAIFLRTGVTGKSAVDLARYLLSEFGSLRALLEADLSGCVAMRFIDNHGKVTETYPANPNGSPRGITGLTSRDGRVTIMMPHPERVFRAVQNSWKPDDWQEDAGWMRMFRNARVWVD